MSNEQVKAPSHYVEGRKHEPKDVIRDWGLNFNLGNAVKYVARAGRKDDIVQDLRKAQEYTQFEIDAIEEHRAKATKPVSTIHPVFTELENGKGVSCVGIELEVPAGATPEDIIKAVISKLYGGE